jgi:hypothetical protein
MFGNLAAVFRPHAGRWAVISLFTEGDASGLRIIEPDGHDTIPPGVDVRLDPNTRPEEGPPAERDDALELIGGYEAPDGRLRVLVQGVRLLHRYDATRVLLFDGDDGHFVRVVHRECWR